MTVTGIIAEYNPFHSGHAKHLAKARQLTGADFLVVVMSGDFVQRGEPALFNKYTRARMALEAGADLVFELPAPFSTAGGPDFAKGAIALLDGLGIVDNVIFGSESGSIDEILAAADYLNHESDKAGELIRQGQKRGLSYPAAVSRALLTLNPDFSPALLSSPNNLLGIEYCRALANISSTIRPMTMKRSGDYHAGEISAEAPAAAALRSAFITLPMQDALTAIKPALPEQTFSLLQSEVEKSGPLFFDDFTDALFLKVLLETRDTITRYQDISLSLSARIQNNILYSHSISELAETVKCKAYTRLRVNRALVHCLLGITVEDMDQFRQPDFRGFARVLGIRESAFPLLSEITRHAKIPLLIRLKEDSARLSDSELRLLAINDFSANLYRMTIQRKYGCDLPDEYSRRLLRV